MSEQRFHILLMGAIDGELDQQEFAEFEQLLSENANFQEEYKEYKKLKEVTQKMQFKPPSPEVWDNYWTGIYNRLERGIGWIFFSIGCIILLMFGGYKLVESIIADPNLSPVVKAGILFLIAGLAVLLVSVVREKLTIYKSDPYKEIKR
ncbi:hypothetical protein JW935_11015 [candidate division KSB1 bacterium]|nr:hypothetical protein [candidate division KSB1 bacterium]